MKKLIIILTAFICVDSFCQQHYPIKNMLGVNVHQWDVWYYDFAPYKGSYDAKYKALIDFHPSSLRIYLDADTEQDSSGNYAFNPSYRGGFEPETGIKRIKASNPEIFIQACYQRQTPSINKEWVNAGIWDSPLNFPWKYNNDIDRIKSSSYSNMAHDMAILAIRGGRNKNAPDYPVYTSSAEPWMNNYVIKGENFYDAVEGGNEWNWWWSDRNHNLNSYELAAAWKAMFDSVKSVDSTMLFTNGGLAYALPDTFLKAKQWWQNHGYQTPVDYYSIHSYPDAEYTYGYGVVKGGLNPEGEMYRTAKVTVSAVDKPVVVGEWGWDVNPHSVQNAPAFDNYTAEETRGNWAIRMVLKFAQAGVYRAQWYRAYQDQPNSVSDSDATQYATMALLRQEDATTIHRTLAGDYFKQINLFGDYVFDKAIRDDSVQHLQFAHNAQTLQALWSVETYMISNNRPVFTERKIKYTLPNGAVYGLNEDSSGMIISYHHTSGDTLLTSKPFFFIADPTILPIDTTTYKPPVVQEHYNVQVFDFMGNHLKSLDRKNITEESFKAQLPKHRYFILIYRNEKHFKTEKIFKQ